MTSTTKLPIPNQNKDASDNNMAPDRHIILLRDVASNSGNTSPWEDGYQVVHNNIRNLQIQKKGWVRDELVISCEICGVEFNMFTRKHHCRCCGNIFCYHCTKYWTILPDLNSLRIGRLETMVISDSPKSPERVCSFCYKNITDFEQLRDNYFVISHLPLSLMDLRPLALVSSRWNRVFQYFVSNFKFLLENSWQRIEGHLTPLGVAGKFTLHNNRFLFSGHSRWLIMYIQSLDSSCGISESELLKILYSPRQTSCRSLQCDGQCRSQMSTEEAIIGLSSFPQHQVARNYLLDLLCSGTIKELCCYLPILVDMLRNDQYHGILLDYLASISRRNYEFANFLFWELTTQMTDLEFREIFAEARIAVTDELRSETKQHLQQTFYFVENFSELVTNVETFPTLLPAYFKTLSDRGDIPISSPVNPYRMIHSVDGDGIHVKRSCSRPVIVPFQAVDATGNNETKLPYQLLFKREDIRKELIIMNLIKLTDMLLQQEEGLDLQITTYNILPTSDRSGFIEIVPDSETIYSVNLNQKFSILNYILEHNPNKSVDEVRTTFTQSCVAYCLFSYLLGIGDRHMENIMLKNTGEIFHIDFGFILGSDPKPLAPEIRITNEMIDAMGGYESKHYVMFKELCGRAFLCLRRHIELYRVIFQSFARSRPRIDPLYTKEYIDRYVDNKFLVNENVQNVKLYLINKVATKSQGYSGSLIDLCHQAQGTPQTITNSIAKTASSLGSQLVSMFWK